MQDYNNYTHITTVAVAGAITRVTTEAATLKAVIVNVKSVYTVGIINTSVLAGVTAGNSGIGKIASLADTRTYLYNVRCGNGIKIVTTGALAINPDITVVWRQ